MPSWKRACRLLLLGRTPLSEKDYLVDGAHEKACRPQRFYRLLMKAKNMSEVASGPILFYNDLVVEHFSAPRHVGELPPEETDGFGIVGDPACGDQMKLWIKVSRDRIEKIAFKSYGCPGAIATSSMLCTLAADKRLSEAKQLTDDDVIEALDGIPEKKRHCSLLGVQALSAAIADYEHRIK